MKESPAQLIERLIADQLLISATFSSPFDKKKEKIQMRPLQLKQGLHYQMTTFTSTQAFHQNLTPQEAQSILLKSLPLFKQIHLSTKEADYQILTGNKNTTVIKNAPSKKTRLLTHNRPKEYLLSEGVPIPFLVRLGIMGSNGKVHAAKQDKFRQINRFLEMVDDILPHLPKNLPLEIVDFGCGKAYLTFALYHFLKELQGYSVHLVGIDLKKEVIAACNELASELGYGQEMEFICGDIQSASSESPVDLVVALHACDTATDAALEKAVQWKARAILCAPCCQHELYSQVQHGDLTPLLKHGILKERFAALATDAARGELLESLGYKVQILEFIDVEHTPKNLLIRAIRGTGEKEQQQARERYQRFKGMLHIYPSFERFIKTIFHNET